MGPEKGPKLWFKNKVVSISMCSNHGNELDRIKVRQVYLSPFWAWQDKCRALQHV